MRLPTDALLNAAGQLPPDQLDAFVERVVELRAIAVAPSLDRSETKLLMRINARPSDAETIRYAELIAKRDAESLAAEEQHFGQIEADDVSGRHAATRHSGAPARSIQRGGLGRYSVVLGCDFSLAPGYYHLPIYSADVDSPRSQRRNSAAGDSSGTNRVSRK